MTSKLVLLSLCVGGLSFAQVRRGGETARDVRALNVDRREKRDDVREPLSQLTVGIAEERLQNGNAIEAQKSFVGIVQKLAEIGAPVVCLGKSETVQLQDEQRMLRHR